MEIDALSNSPLCFFLIPSLNSLKASAGEMALVQGALILEVHSADLRRGSLS